MTILGIESASLTASCAILKDSVIIAEFSTNFKKTHSQTLLPMIENLMSMCSLKGSDIDMVAVSEGPGSFTGLRIGASIAKGLAYAWNKPIVPVPTIDAMAFALPDTGRIICPIMDARRNQVYTGLYENDGGVLKVHRSAFAEDIKKVICEAEALSLKFGKNVVFMGDGLIVYENIIREIYSEGYKKTPEFASDCVRYQRAGSLCFLGKNLFDEGKTVSAADCSPLYLRMSQAEQERMEGGNI